MIIGPRCKICRRLGTKLFLKGERCFGQKCEIVKRNYPPGLRSKRRGRKISDYGRGLMEKQKIKNWYNLSEKQLSTEVKSILSRKKGEGELDTGDQLIKRLESRLDNFDFRMGFAPSRSEARQLVNHGHFTVNGKKVDIPSYKLSIGDEIEVKPESKEKKKMKEVKALLKSFNPPSWISLDKENMKGKILNLPSVEEAGVPVETSAVFEFYSK